MLIDDDDNLRGVITETLQARGNVSVMSCASCKRAIGVSRQFSPNLILLDLRMPGKDGTETLKALREIKALDNVPVIFVTGAHKVNMIDDYKKLGVIGVIHKPFTPSELKEYISGIWGEHHMAG